MNIEGYVIAKETVVEVPGERPDLGYTLYPESVIFLDQDQAMKVLVEANAPLGWVVIPMSRLFYQVI